MKAWAATRLVLAASAAVPAVAVAAADRPVELPVVELYTIGQGDQLFEKFGHAALCLRPPGKDPRSRCYNYGTTDFDSVVPLFWGFVRGRSRFWVSTSSLPRMIRHYRGA